MMIRLLLLVAGLAVGAVAAYGLRDESGYVVLRMHGWVIETSVLGLLLALLALGVSIWAVLRLLIGGLRLPASLRATLERRRVERARTSFESGLAQLTGGHWKRTELALVKRAADHPAAHLNYLAAARAAQRLGAAERRDQYLQTAANVAPGSGLLVQITQTQLALARGDLGAAREVAEQALRDAPESAALVDLLAECLSRQQDWEALQRLLVEQRGDRMLDGATRRNYWLQCLPGNLQAAALDSRLDRIKALWSEAPRDIQSERSVRQAYVNALVRANAEADAAAFVVKALEQDWDPQLAVAYGRIVVGDAVAQLAQIETWLSRHGESPELLLAAGRTCLRNRLWGKARSYLEAVQRSVPSAEVFMELARLAEQTQQPEQAQQYYREGLRLATGQDGATT